jgi:hypothetical protein
MIGETKYYGKEKQVEAAGLRPLLDCERTAVEASELQKKPVMTLVIKYD